MRDGQLLRVEAARPARYRQRSSSRARRRPCNREDAGCDSRARERRHDLVGQGQLPEDDLHRTLENGVEQRAHAQQKAFGRVVRPRVVWARSSQQRARTVDIVTSSGCASALRPASTQSAAQRRTVSMPRSTSACGSIQSSSAARSPPNSPCAARGSQESVVFDQLLELDNGQIRIVQRAEEPQMPEPVPGHFSRALSHRLAEEESLKVREAEARRFFELRHGLDLFRKKRSLMVGRRQTLLDRPARRPGNPLSRSPRAAEGRRSARSARSRRARSRYAGPAKLAGAPPRLPRLPRHLPGVR